VGVLDADIYGPSQPIMLGIRGRPESRDGKSMEPMNGHGLQVISIGFLVDQDQAMVWRGPWPRRRWTSCCARPTGTTWTT
jgi:ATP-binding protein involved in chromosome partitioning